MKSSNFSKRDRILTTIVLLIYTLVLGKNTLFYREIMYRGVVKEKYENYNMYHDYDENLDNSGYNEHEIKALDILVHNAYDFEKTIDFMKTLDVGEQSIKVIEDLEKNSDVKTYHYLGLTATFAFFVFFVIVVGPLIGLIIDRVKGAISNKTKLEERRYR